MLICTSLTSGYREVPSRGGRDMLDLGLSKFESLLKSKGYLQNTGRLKWHQKRLFEGPVMDHFEKLTDGTV